MTIAISQLPTIASSVLLAKFHSTTAAVAKHGAMLVTRHDQPSLVLVSLERYREWEEASSPSLDALAREFDEMYGAMQTQGAADRMAIAFAMNPSTLGHTAASAAAATTAATAAADR